MSVGFNFYSCFIQLPLSCFLTCLDFLGLFLLKDSINKQVKCAPKLLLVNAVRVDTVF